MMLLYASCFSNTNLCFLSLFVDGVCSKQIFALYFIYERC